ncbi:phage tail tape measure protein [Enterococcus gallinarum]|uniref:phage tail tape measure protein n=1 Tax=Enterococcus gallinarum TaxID=1353 RepID=UPI0032E4AFB4
MATNLGNLAATASLNIDPFQQSTRVLETQMRSIDRALKSSETAFKNNSKNIAAQKTQFTLTGKQIQVYTAQLEKQKEKYEGLRAEIGDVNKATADQKTQLLAAEAAVNKTAGQIESLTGKYNALGKEIAVSESNWTKSGKVLEEIGNKTTKVGDTLSSVGTKMTMGVTVPIVAGVTAVTKAAMDWESSFAGVKKTNDEVVDSNGNVVYSYEDLEMGLRNLAKQLPSTHSEIAAVAETAGQLGIATQDVISFTKTMIDMGESTNLSAEDAATAIAKIANITGLTSAEYERFGSSVVALGNNFATTESDIVALATRLASAGTLAGLTETEILALSTAMSSVGIEAEAGGTAMTQTLTAIEKAVVAGGDSLKQFADLADMSSEQFVKTWQDKPIEAVQAFIKGLGELDGKGESATLMLDEMGLSGVRQSNMLKSLALASDTLTSAVDMSNEAWSQNTALSEEANKRYETVESQLGMLKNEVIDVAIEFGGPFLQALRDGLQAAKPFIQTIGDIAKKFSEANPETQQAIMKYIGLAAALGPATKLMGGFLKVTGGGLTAVGKFNQWIGKAATGSTLFGTAAANAAGSSGVGAMVTALGSGGLAGVMPAIIGAGGLLAVGYGAWKLFGEEAWNSSQRVQRWGTDVGSVVDTTLSGIKSKTDEASGQFGLMADGFTADSESMVTNFEKIGQTIEDSLIKKVDGLDQLLKELPKSIDSSVKDMVEDEKSKAESALQTVQENTDRITSIKKAASNNSREISVSEAKIIQDLAKNTTEAYIETLDVSASEKKKILTAMTADVSNATQAEAKLWLQSLGEQRRAAQENATISRQEKEKYLEDLGYNLDGEFAKKFLSAWDEINATTVQGFDSQMETILKKYPELQNEVSLANGQLISSMGDYADSAIAENEKILKSASDLSRELSANAEKNAEKLSWTASESSKAGKLAAQTWNDLVFDEKSGEVKSNVAEVVTEATKDSTTWNNLKLVVHDADLDSNAKDIVGEAAIANGWWEGLAWSDKKAILGDEFSQTMYKALEDSGRWDEMSFDEKKAFLYSNTPEVMAETMLQLGLWDSFQPEIKELNAENYELLNALSYSQSALEEYNTVDPDFKELLASDPATITVEQSKSMLEQYNSLSPELKVLLGQNTNMIAVVSAAQTKINDYNTRYTPGVKHLHATSDTSAVDYMRTQIDSIPNYTEKRVAVVYEGRNTGQYATNATGNPYFEGGLTWLGDGGKAEPYLTPQGQFGISPADWTMYNLPRGTKIWPSVQKMMESLPQYANGTKFDDTKLSRLSVASNNFANPPAPASAQNQVDLKEVIKLLRIIAQKNFIISKDAIGSIANKYAGENFFKLLYNGGGLN